MVAGPANSRQSRSFGCLRAYVSAAGQRRAAALYALQPGSLAVWRFHAVRLALADITIAAAGIGKTVAPCLLHECLPLPVSRREFRDRINLQVARSPI